MNDIINTIIDHSTEYAKNLLEDTTQCYPFGAYIDRSGIVHPVEFNLDTVKDVPNNETVIDSLTIYCDGELKEKRILAYGLTYEASVQMEEGVESIDTISIDIKTNEEEQPPIYYFPYSITNDELEYGEAFAVKR